MRRDSKLIITKISPSSKYYKPEDKESKSEYTPTNTDIESIASYADFEGFSEATPALSRPWNDNHKDAGINANLQPKPAINNLQPKQTNDSSLNEPVNADSMAFANNDKTTPINPVLLTQDYTSTDKADINAQADKAVDRKQEPQTLAPLTQRMPTLEAAPFQNGELTNILNSIYKQANEQNENQRTQYEKLTKTLNDSIQAKTNAEQEQINKFNNCIATIEKTFSAGTFDRIIEHIDNMAAQFVRNQEAKNNEFNNKFEFIDNDITNLLETTRQQQEAINEIKEGQESDNVDNNNEQLEDMNIIINELNEKIQEQEDTINQLKASLNTTIKQHADLINKLSLAVYNIDESIYSQIFNKQAQAPEWMPTTENE